jgi:hypothetical protein
VRSISNKEREELICCELQGERQDPKPIPIARSISNKEREELICCKLQGKHQVPKPPHVTRSISNKERGELIIVFCKLKKKKKLLHTFPWVLG